MRSAFVHEATIELAPDADEAAPGAAVTVGLCGAEAAIADRLATS